MPATSGGMNQWAHHGPSQHTDLPYQMMAPHPGDIASLMATPRGGDPQQVLDAWGLLGGSHLRVLQSQALQASGAGMTAANQAGGDVAVVGGPNVPTRQLFREVADAYVDARYQLGRMNDAYENLSLQEAAAEQARQRKAEGKAGKMDVLQSESAIGLTKTMMSPIRDDLQRAIDRLASLTGNQPSPALLKGIANSPQLRFPGLDRRLPAAVLRQRHDVRSAEQRVVQIGLQAGIPEVTLMPHLSLQGELTAKTPEKGSEAKSLNESLDLDIGGAETWNFAAADETLSGMGHGGGYSPVGQTMRGFQTTVYTAADQVESLLTQYQQALSDVETLEQTQENASEAARLALQQFQVDRIDGSFVTNAQMRRVEAGQALEQARARLASVAVSLLVATGGECYPEMDPSTVYQPK